MSCNGYRVLRKGCSETCILRSCLRWIDSPKSQGNTTLFLAKFFGRSDLLSFISAVPENQCPGNATLFLAKFFGRSDLLSFISAVPENQRPALFQSLLFEACGRTVNQVGGAVELLSTGNWHVCHTTVQTVLSDGVLRQYLQCRRRNKTKPPLVSTEAHAEHKTTTTHPYHPFSMTKWNRWMWLSLKG